MAEVFNEIERRVLGVLMEKAMTQPDYYPMTANAIVAACNQKNNREPVMTLDEGTIEDTLEQLRRRGLISVVLPAPGARANRYRHEVAGKFGWEKRVMAVMTELLLRGPQTAGELRSRCSRFVAFEDVNAVMTTLEYLENAESPLVRPMPRQPGRSAVRFMHLMHPPEELAALESAAPAAEITAAVSRMGSRTGLGSGTRMSAPSDPGVESYTPSASSADHAATADASLVQEVDHLRAEVAHLRESLTNLTRRLESLENDLRR